MSFISQTFFSQNKITQPDSQFEITGGDFFDYTDGADTYRVHEIKSTQTIEALNKTGVIDILIVGGGGGGRSLSTVGGGGGAGQVLSYTSVNLSVGTYNIVIGGGGGSQTDGSNTTFLSYTSIGGKKGIYNKGGNSGNGFVGGNGSGEAGCIPNCGGGGGAGANQNGFSSGATAPAHFGGSGLSTTIKGTTEFFGGGGGGGRTNTSNANIALGGNGGGGTGGGANMSNAPFFPWPFSGSINTGGGGGGSGWINQPGGSGGSGIVIIRYKLGQ